MGGTRRRGAGVWVSGATVVAVHPSDQAGGAMPGAQPGTKTLCRGLRYDVELPLRRLRCLRRRPAGDKGGEEDDGNDYGDDDEEEEEDDDDDGGELSESIKTKLEIELLGLICLALAKLASAGTGRLVWPGIC